MRYISLSTESSTHVREGIIKRGERDTASGLRETTCSTTEEGDRKGETGKNGRDIMAKRLVGYRHTRAV